MPEAAVDEDRLPSAEKGEVWCSWKVFAVQSIPIPHSVKEAPHHHLRLGVLASDLCHSLAALGRGERVSHGR
jgi:hypothetical protein